MSEFRQSFFVFDLRYILTIGVMHNGLLLEMGKSDEIYNHGVHPYTESLLSAIPLPDPDHERVIGKSNTAKSTNQLLFLFFCRIHTEFKSF